MKKLTIIQADGTTTTEQHEKADLNVLQKHVGGLIQLVPCFDEFEGCHCDVFVNEEGKISGLPLNEIATGLWKGELGAGPFWYEPELFGTVVIVQDA